MADAEQKARKKLEEAEKKSKVSEQCRAFRMG